MSASQAENSIDSTRKGRGQYGLRCSQVKRDRVATGRRVLDGHRRDLLAASDIDAQLLQPAEVDLRSQ